MTGHPHGITRPARMALDALTVAASLALSHSLSAAWLQGQALASASRLGTYWPLLLAVSCFWVWLLDRFGGYDGMGADSVRSEMARLAAVAVVGLTAIVVAALLLEIPVGSRSGSLIFAPVAYAALLAQRTVLRRRFGAATGSRRRRTSTLVVGTATFAQEFAAESARRPEWGLDIIGLVGPAPANRAALPVLGGYGDVSRLTRDLAVDQIIVAVPVEELPQMAPILALCTEEGIRVLLLSAWLDSRRDHAGLAHFDRWLALTIDPAPDKEWQLFVKRLVDIGGAGMALIALAPLLLAIALAVRCTSDGPVFYRWRVIGLNRRPFVSYKFRTMVANADQLKAALEPLNHMSGPVFKIRRDPRVTPLGRVLRKYSLDELPQFWSVLKGDMSLIGPRPPLATELPRFKGWHRRKLCIKPGMTSLWTVNGRSDITDFDEWARLDLEYINRWSLWLDAKILLRTIPAVLSGRGAY